VGLFSLKITEILIFYAYSKYKETKENFLLIKIVFVNLPNLSIPKHVAIIMDGNGRWARARNLPTIQGHNAGAEAVKKTVRTAKKLGVQHLTLYTFSTENWKRPKLWISDFFKLMHHYLTEESNLFIEEQVKVHIIGDVSGFPKLLQQQVQKLVEDTKNFQGLQVNIALGYGSRDEIMRAFKKIMAQGISLDAITEDLISQNLDTQGIPDPELLIRPSGEVRISNYLLWQLAYTELYFTSVLWPDFTEEHFIEAIKEFSKRDRRFGDSIEDNSRHAA